MDRIFAERSRFGRFYYRFDNGEAGTDVFDRMTTFITYLFRSMGAKRGYFQGRQSPSAEDGELNLRRARPVRNYVLVTHGLLMRIFCMCYFRWTVTEFERVWNPANGEIWVLQKVSACTM